jgi:hypothetical protein
MQNLLARVGNPALRQGLIFGIILGIALLALSIVVGGSLIIIVALCLLAAILAGRRASQETGRITTGTLAGLWTGLFGILIPDIISFVFLLINIDAAVKSDQQSANSQHLQITYTPSLVITDALISLAILIALGALFGAAGGFIGGSLGRRRAQLPPAEEYQEAMVESTLEAPVEDSATATSSEESASPTPPAE